MHRFLGKLFAFGAVQALVLAVLVALYPGHTSDYLEATIGKHRLADSTPAPRLVHVGGSSAAFGLDCAALEAATGKGQVNLALHIGVGLDFMLAEALDVLKPGDTAVLHLEYELFAYDPIDMSTVVQLVEARPASGRYLDWRQRKRFFDSGLVFVRQFARSAVKFPRPTAAPGYSRDAFNEYGDVVGHHELGSRYTADPRSLPPLPVDPEHVRAVIDALNAFAAECRDRGVDVVFFYPPTPLEEAPARGDVHERIAAMLSQRADFKVLNRPGEMYYPANLFYDTGYHVTLEGKERRTALIIDRLARLP